MRLLLGVAVGIMIVALAAGAIVWTGSFNVAASVPPGKIEEALARFALNRAVTRRAGTAKNPLAASAQTRASGLAQYRENCVGCHGAPGVEAAEFGQGLNPAAPDLTLPRVQRRPDGELYWIVANGIRMTGMPSFAPTHKPEEIWKIVAFLRHLPELTAEEEKQLQAATEAGEGHHEAGSGAGNQELASPGGSATADKPSRAPSPGAGPKKD